MYFMEFLEKKKMSSFDPFVLMNVMDSQKLFLHYYINTLSTQTHCPARLGLLLKRSLDCTLM